MINVGAGSRASLNDAVELARHLVGRHLSIEQTTAGSGDVPVTCADPSTAQRTLGWNPRTDRVTGMTAQLQWLKNASRSGHLLVAGGSAGP
ncbi:hypothetical protein [Planotetraspora sp. GP83]|uniref:hypothetical protein n=1 Tax=Planotetraspora sp. GP83 TaxID=3156264 RepID=UPI003513BE98